MDISERIHRYLAQIPPSISGAGGHNQTFAVACQLINGFALSESEALSYLHQYNQRCQPKWNDNELAHKIRSAINAQHSKPRGHLIGGNGTFHKDDFRRTSYPAKQQPAAKATIDPVTAVEKFLKGFRCTESDIYDASSIKPGEDWTKDGVLLAHALYQPGELINYVTDFKMSATKDGGQKPVPHGFGVTTERDELCSMWDAFGPTESEIGGWMRINPMTGKGIGDKDVTSFRYLLLEFDSIPLDLQLSFFARLPLPIAAILTSGGKSIHAWVKADAKDPTEYKDTTTMLLKMLSPLGIDPKNKNPSRLSRLVGVTRKLGAGDDGRQRLLFLNPSPQQEAIL